MGLLRTTAKPPAASIQLELQAPAMKKMKRMSHRQSRQTDFTAAWTRVADRPGIAVSAMARLLDLYHALLAPFVAAQTGSSCRFEPSCSRYAKTALARHGVWRGAWLAMRRLARCHPWGGYGYDPVPQGSSPKSGSY